MRPLHLAAIFGWADIVELLLRAGVDVKARTDNGATPLWLAASADKVSCIGTLIQAGADFEAKSDNGMTPLEIAAEKGNSAVEEVLRKAGAQELAPASAMAKKSAQPAVDKSIVADVKDMLRATSGALNL